MFKNRQEAGLKLAQKLSSYKKKAGILVLGIPRGGVATAVTVAKALDVPLDVIITRKIGAPSQPELALGAVGPNGTVTKDNDLINRLAVEEEWLKKQIKVKRQEVKERGKLFRNGRPQFNLKGKIIILVDDGIATGSTVEAAIKYIQTKGPTKLILAVPVVPKDMVERLSGLVDEVVLLEAPASFSAVGEFYQDFPQVSDEEVIQLLQ